MRGGSELPAGPELDRLIQEQVFDQQETASSSPSQIAPPYSTNEFTSSQVVARLQFLGFAIHEASVGDGQWTIAFVKGPQARQAIANTRALARCRAALLAFR